MTTHVPVWEDRYILIDFTKYTIYHTKVNYIVWAIRIIYSQARLDTISIRENGYSFDKDYELVGQTASPI